MASLNQVSLIGYLGDEPKYYEGQDGKQPVAAINIATTDKGYTRQDGTQVPDITDWHSVSFFGKQADFVKNYARKGSLVYVQGKIRNRSYEKDGVKHYSYEVVGNIIELLDRKSDGQQPVQG